MAVSPEPQDGKIEVSTLLPQEITFRDTVNGGKDDLSAGKTGDISELLAEDIKDRRRLRWFQTVAFYGAIALIGFTFYALFRWLDLIGTHATDPNVTTTYRVSFFVAPVVVLASLGALLTLALLKFAFRPSDKKEEDPSPISIMQGLATQVIDLAKAYLGGKKGEG
ncbi:hypothetical protein PQQ75_04115 [Paraburkholderia aspalathi]|uniref:hypothetical protein n=1 Tax=Paraburkholderia aspalathi TaxID=1324617 RepID=UPI0038BA7395